MGENSADARTDSVVLADAADPLIVAIDVGSSSVRAILYDASATRVQSMEVHIPYQLTVTDAGAVEVEADALAILVSSCLDELMSRMKDTARPVRAVSVSTFWHSLVGVDESHRAVTPIYTWADTRSRRAAESLKARLDESELRQRTGAPLHSSYLPAKLTWLRGDCGDLFVRATYWMSFGEYLYLTLFGTRQVSISMASGSGLFDQHRCVWDQDLLSALDIPISSLSEVHEYNAAQTRLQPRAAARWSGLDGVPWFLPLGDGACNNIGSGAFDEKVFAVMVGTSGALRVVHDPRTFKVPPGLWTYHLDRSHVVQGGALSEGGNTFAWLMHTLHVAPGDIDDVVARLPADGHGLTVLPFLAGERSPGWRSEARATVHGLTLDTSPAEVVRAFMESVAFRFATVYDLLTEVVAEPRSIIGSGAGLENSPAWMQIMADALARPITVSSVPESSSRGAAIMALRAMGVITDFGHASAIAGREFRPRARNVEHYRAARQRQMQLEQRLAGFDE